MKHQSWTHCTAPTCVLFSFAKLWLRRVSLGFAAFNVLCKLHRGPCQFGVGLAGLCVIYDLTCCRANL